MGYLRNGSQLVWLIFPKTRIIEIRQLNDDGVITVRQLTDTNILDGDGVFVGLSLPVTKILPKS